MKLQSWSCKGCTNICHLEYKGEVHTYCNTSYFQPDNKGLEWQGDYCACLDYTTDPYAEIKEVKKWFEPPYKQKGAITLEDLIEHKPFEQLRLF